MQRVKFKFSHRTLVARDASAPGAVGSLSHGRGSFAPASRTSRTEAGRSKYRGALLIHSGLKVNDVNDYVKDEFGLTLPEGLATGGIVGVVDVIGCVDDDSSPWFAGTSCGWKLANPRRLRFWKCKAPSVFFRPNLEQGCSAETNRASSSQNCPQSASATDLLTNALSLDFVTLGKGAHFGPPCQKSTTRPYLCLVSRGSIVNRRWQNTATVRAASPS